MNHHVDPKQWCYIEVAVYSFWKYRIHRLQTSIICISWLVKKCKLYAILSQGHQSWKMLRVICKNGPSMIFRANADLAPRKPSQHIGELKRQVVIIQNTIHFQGNVKMWKVIEVKWEQYEGEGRLCYILSWQIYYYILSRLGHRYIQVPTNMKNSLKTLNESFVDFIDVYTIYHPRFIQHILQGLQYKILPFYKRMPKLEIYQYNIQFYVLQTL